MLTQILFMVKVFTDTIFVYALIVLTQFCLWLNRDDTVIFRALEVEEI